MARRGKAEAEDAGAVTAAAPASELPSAPAPAAISGGAEAPPSPEVPPAVRMFEVVEEKQVFLRGAFARLPKGKVVSSALYDVGFLEAQGVKLREV